MARTTLRLCGTARPLWKVLVPLWLATVAAAVVLSQGRLFHVELYGTNLESPTPSPTASVSVASSKHAASPGVVEGLPPVPSALTAQQRSEADLRAAMDQPHTGAQLLADVLDHEVGRRLLGSSLYSDIATTTQGDATAFGHSFLASDKHTIASYGMLSLCEGLWDDQQYVLALSFAMFSTCWPLLILVCMLVIWWVAMASELRQGLSSALLFLTKWGFLVAIFVCIWITILRVHTPLGQTRVQADWGLPCLGGALFAAYITLLLFSNFERPRCTTAKAKVDSVTSVSFHAVFFTLAAVTAVLLVAALTLPAYTSTTRFSYTDTDGNAQETVLEATHTLITVGEQLWSDGGWSRQLSVIYVVLVTTLPGISLVMAVVAWVTSPLESRGDEDTNLAMMVCDFFARLCTLDVWLYAFGVTYMKLDYIAGEISSQSGGYTIHLDITVHLAVFCAMGCVVCLWMMHTLAQYAHSAPSDATMEETDQGLMEPVFSPPTDINSKHAH